MKTKSSLLLALTAFTAMTFAPQTALAGHREDKVALAIGGLIGGIIIGKNLERHREPVRYETTSRVVIVESRNACPPPPRGYWKEVRNRVYVPARTTIEYDSCGRRIRTYEPAYYTYETTRVWVENDCVDSYTWESSARYVRR